RRDPGNDLHGRELRHLSRRRDRSGGPVLVQAKDESSALRRAVEAAAAAAGAPLQFLTAPDSPMALPFASPPAEVVTLALPVRFLNTPSEVVTLKDLEALCDILERFIQPGGAK
ncbi:MAG: hypothetical protein ACXWFJ_09540, partial [Candidatus Aminicenantales bacterium]